MNFRHPFLSPFTIKAVFLFDTHTAQKPSPAKNRLGNRTVRGEPCGCLGDI